MSSLFPNWIITQNPRVEPLWEVPSTFLFELPHSVPQLQMPCLPTERFSFAPKDVTISSPENL